jgi:hypothetical protein
VTLIYALSLFAFSHIRCFISVLWWVSTSYLRSNFKAYFLRTTFSRLIRKCYVDDKLSINEFRRQLNTEMATVIRLSIYAFSTYVAISRNTTPAHNESAIPHASKPITIPSSFGSTVDRPTNQRRRFVMCPALPGKNSPQCLLRTMPWWYSSTHSWPWYEMYVTLSASRPVLFTVREIPASVHWKGDWVGPGASLVAVAKGKISYLCREPNPGLPAHSLVPILTDQPGSTVAFSQKSSYLIHFNKLLWPERVSQAIFPRNQLNGIRSRTFHDAPDESVLLCSGNMNHHSTCHESTALINQSKDLRSRSVLPIRT